MNLFKLVPVLLGSLLLILAVGCVTPKPALVSNSKHEVIIRVLQNGSAVNVEALKGNRSGRISKGMDVPNPAGSLSRMASLMGDEAFIKLYSSLTVGDVSNLANDIKYLYKMTPIRKISIFINSPGGDAFSGLALADQIEKAKRLGFEVTMEASGIIASAAVPVFAVGTKGKRFAAPGTIFMVHETSIWKWPGRETASDIRSQNSLMNLIRDRYLEKLADNSKLSIEKWGDMEGKTTWFSADKAKDWGLVDHVE